MPTRSRTYRFMMNTAIAFIVYKRPDTTKRVFETIRQARPSRLYLIADGPKTPDLEARCREVRQIVENGIDWDCELRPVYSDKNLGLAKRVQTGLDEVFSHEKAAIILEDDTLPNDSFFRFCEELLELYKHDEKVGHISGCNLHPEAFHANSTYCFSSIINIWGWATWRRSWKDYDLKMSKWVDQNKDELLSNWCITKNHKKHTKEMFDLHCNNENPWSWDFQWNFSCWAKGSLSIIPCVNLVSNLGIRPDASNTKALIKIPLFPKKTSSINKIIHPPEVSKDTRFDSDYFKYLHKGIIRKLINSLRSILNKIQCL